MTLLLILSLASSGRQLGVKSRYINRYENLFFLLYSKKAMFRIEYMKMHLKYRKMDLKYIVAYIDASKIQKDGS